MPRIIQQRHESELLVECARQVVDGIDLDSSDPDLLGQALGSSQGINEEQGTESASLDAPVDRETTQQDHRHVDPRQALREFVGQVLAGGPDDFEIA